LARPGGHRDCAYLASTIARENITTIHFVPSLLRVFLEEDLADSCRSLKRVICSGEELTLDLQQRFFEKVGAELHNLYGPTEAAVDVTAWACRPEEDASQDGRVPIGRQIDNVKIYILDRRLMFCPDPLSNKPGARLYKTGDVAELLPDGNIKFLGRVDAQVKIRGARVEPGEIESALIKHPLVNQAVVLAGPDGAGHMRLVAYVVPSRGEKLNRVELRSFLETRLPKYSIPSVFVILDELPLTPGGKLNRTRLSDLGRQDDQALLADLLDRIEQLSEEEVMALL
jgi:acyl-coenzyme A synthetase/AMP-(fatty) acid ligase